MSACLNESFIGRRGAERFRAREKEKEDQVLHSKKRDRKTREGLEGLYSHYSKYRRERTNGLREAE